MGITKACELCSFGWHGTSLVAARLGRDQSPLPDCWAQVKRASRPPWLALQAQMLEMLRLPLSYNPAGTH